ncbi:MAG: CotH kinase family protein [Zavarzinella sp.]
MHIVDKIALVCVLIGNCAGIDAAEPAENRWQWQPTHVAKIQIELTAKEYDAMQPPRTGGFGGFGGFPMTPRPNPVVPPKEGDREVHRGVFGTDFPVARGKVTINDRTAGDVAIRYKGNSTYLATANGLKRSFKIDFDEFVDDQHLFGLKKINLHCGVHDPSKIREALCYQTYRDVGVPAPQTCFAEVRLNVPGRFDNLYLGCYTMTEQVNKPFLRKHFGTDKGVLFKPERVRSLDYLGEQWEPYEKNYQPKGKAKDAQQKRLIEFVKLVNRGSDQEFAAQIGKFLDVESYLRFLATTAVTANLDSFFTNGHNYYLYLHPESNQFHFVPWDTDLSLGNFAFFGSPTQQADLSVRKPYVQNRLTDRLLALPDMPKKYLELLQDVLQKGFTEKIVLQHVKDFEATVQPILEKELQAMRQRRESPFSMPGFQKAPPVGEFVKQRLESIQKQLTSDHPGYQPKGFSFGPGGFGPPKQPFPKQPPKQFPQQPNPFPKRPD